MIGRNRRPAATNNSVRFHRQAKTAVNTGLVQGTGVGTARSNSADVSFRTQRVKTSNTGPGRPPCQNDTPYRG